MAVAAALVTVLLASFAAGLQAAEKNDPTGTWKWSVEFNGNKREVTLKLKAEGEKLTGTISGRNNSETNIEDGTVKDGEVSFKVTRERNGQKFTQTYKGKVDGDTLKGKVSFERNGETNSRDFEAKRS
ncbi:MAG TPA: hypothetical protein VHB77_22375 [Planctomycetaceae bacterium]|nr:hypothetical protein [Planctomycetaceae bacterium]